VRNVFEAERGRGMIHEQAVEEGLVRLGNDQRLYGRENEFEKAVAFLIASVGESQIIQLKHSFQQARSEMLRDRDTQLRILQGIQNILFLFFFVFFFSLFQTRSRWR
jgi:hypothetical protein